MALRLVFTRFIERQWQHPTALSGALYPFSLIFRSIVALRRLAYSANLLHTARLSVPVIVVGNTTIGGTGKTPLVLWLADFLSQHGMHPGIVSRGYGAAARVPSAVTAASDAAHAGDEPVLLAQRSGCPVWIGRDRAAAANALLRGAPRCDVIVSDDGLQHYRLARDIEIAVIDESRALGNGRMLPAGPLREPVSRLHAVDAWVINATRRMDAPTTAVDRPSPPIFGSRSQRKSRRAALTLQPTTRSPPCRVRMTLEGCAFHNLLKPQQLVRADYFQDLRVHAVAGIGNPSRFFAHLRSLGISFEEHAFSDHYPFRPADLAFEDCDAIVMTEKDAVKCAAFATEKAWALRVDAAPAPELGALVLRKLKLR